MLLSQQVSFKFKRGSIAAVGHDLSGIRVYSTTAQELSSTFIQNPVRKTSSPGGQFPQRSYPFFCQLYSPYSVLHRILWIEEETNGWYIAVGFALSLLGLLFPVSCNNALLLIAEKYKWIDQTCLELKGPKWFWKLGAVSIVAFGLVTWVNWDIYDRNRKDIFELAQTPVKKLIERNAPPDLQPSQSDPAVIK